MLINNTLRTSLVLLLVLGLQVGCSSFDTDEEKGPAPLIDFEEEREFDKVWATSVGDGQGGVYNRLTPVIKSDHIYIASADGEVEAITVNKGKSVWEVDLDRPLVGGVGAGDDLLLLGSSAGEVVALNRIDGSERWIVDVGGEVLAAPQTNDEIVFVQTFDGQMLGLDANSGKRLWSYRHTVPVLTLRGTSTPLMFRDSVIGAFANGRVVSFDMVTGAVRWNSRIALAKGDSEIERIIDIDGEMLNSNGVLYAVSYQGNIAAIDPVSGRRIWSNDASSHVGMSEGFGNIYLSGQDGSVTAFEKNGQGVRWAQTVLARRKLTGSATLGSYVIVGDVEGYIHALSQVDGHMVARRRVDSDGLQVDLQTVDDMLLVYSNSGKLLAYRLVE